MYNKYWNKKIKYDWYKFNSKLEVRVYNYLKENNYLILELEPVFLLQTKFKYEDKIIREIKYKSDFLIEMWDYKMIIEAKWMKTKDYIIKKKLFLYKMSDFEKEFDCKLKFIEIKNIKELKEKLL